MIQSLFGGSMPHDAAPLLDIVRALGYFNRSGGIQISAIEGHGGALLQYDVMNGRPPLATARNLTRNLDPSIATRPLIRGPFGVGLRALHEDDLYYMLRELAVAHGSLEGHHVNFRLFEAQNREDEHIQSLRILSRLREEGHNVSCQVDMVYSSKRSLGVDYYEATAAKLLNAATFKEKGINPEIISGFGLKDMIGGLRADRHANGGVTARQATKIIMKAADRFVREAKVAPIAIAMHQHEIGNAVDAQAEAGDTFLRHRANYPGVSELLQDALFDGTGFPCMRALVAAYGTYGHDLGLSEKQRNMIRTFEAHIAQSFGAYSFAQVDMNNWPKELLEYGQLASGGVPYVDTLLKGYEKGIARDILDKNGQPIDADKAGALLRCLFVSINGVLLEDLGSAHSVTPAMKLANDLTMLVAISVLRTDFLQKLATSDADLSKPIIGQDGFFRLHYDAMKNPAAMAYFCTPMPKSVDFKTLKLLREGLFDLYFPEDSAKLREVPDKYAASMLKHLSAEEYTDVRMKLRAALMDEDKASDILTAARVDAATAQGFVHRYADVNRASLTEGVRTIRPRAESMVDAVEGLQISRGDAVFGAMLMKPHGTGMDSAARNMCIQPAHLCPETWKVSAAHQEGQRWKLGMEKLRHSPRARLTRRHGPATAAATR
jgi:hypothetical protein